MNGEFVTLSEAQRRLGVDRRQLGKLIERGELAAYQAPLDRESCGT